MLTRGCVVRSSAGKDKDCLLAVIGVTPDGLWVADGRARPLQRPERKNPRHVADTGAVVDEASMATNRELRRALAAMEAALPAGEANKRDTLT